MKIGILGGSFDPVHDGHLHMAVKAKEFAALDEVWLMPAGHSPNKNEKEMTSAQDRLAMCRLAADGLEGIFVSSLEIDSEECSYTYRTFQKLAELYPNDEFYFILGADSLDYFEKWVHPEIIAQHAKLLVINRDGFTVEELNRKAAELQALFLAEIQIVPCEKYPVASQVIRARIAGSDAGTLKCPRASELSGSEGYQKMLELPEPVWEYIFTHKLYGSGQ